MVDYLGYRKKIGIIVPSTNTSVQPESEMLRPEGVTNHIARISIVERPLTTEQGFLEHVQAMREGMRGAVDQVLTCKPDHIVMSVAIEAFWGGVAQADALQSALMRHSSVGVSMGSTAMVAALRKLGAKSIAVLTPHQQRGDDQVRNYFEEDGFAIKRLISLRCASPTLIAHSTEAQMIGAFRELDGDDIDAIVQVGTNLPAVRLAAEAERWFAKPVLAINAVTYWDALRRCGIDDRVVGYGSILERF